MLLHEFRHNNEIWWRRWKRDEKWSDKLILDYKAMAKNFQLHSKAHKHSPESEDKET